MALQVIHTFVSTKPANPDPTLVSSPQWNDGHTITGVGQPNGVATLDGSGLVPVSQIPEISPGSITHVRQSLTNVLTSSVVTTNPLAWYVLASITAAQSGDAVWELRAQASGTVSAANAKMQAAVFVDGYPVAYGIATGETSEPGGALTLTLNVSQALGGTGSHVFELRVMSLTAATWTITPSLTTDTGILCADEVGADDFGTLVGKTGSLGITTFALATSDINPGSTPKASGAVQIDPAGFAVTMVWRFSATGYSYNGLSNFHVDLVNMATNTVVVALAFIATSQPASQTVTFARPSVATIYEAQFYSDTAGATTFLSSALIEVCPT